MPILDAIARHAAPHPMRAAMVIGRNALTYQDLFENAARVRGGLSALPPRRGLAIPGLPPGGRVLAVVTGNVLEFAELFAGATAFPHAVAVLDPGQPEPVLRDMLARLGPDLVIAAEIRGQPVAAARDLDLQVLALDGESGASYRAWRDAAAADFSPDAGREAPFLIGFTSGTTRLPKAFVRARATWRHSLDRGRALFGLSDTLHTVAPGALAHGVTLYALAETLDIGATFRTMPALRPQGLAAILASGDWPRLVTVPSVLTALGPLARPRGQVFPGIVRVVTGGSELDPKSYRSASEIFPNSVLHSYYGASELGFVAVDGSAYPDIGLSIRTETGGIAAPGTVGTIHVASPQAIDGYLWGDDGLAFRRDATGATVGDLGFLDAAGRLVVVGRQGGLIVSGGFNIYPAEVEAALRSIAGIREAAVFGRPDPVLGARLVAVISGAVPGRADLLAECRARLHRQKIPQSFLVTDAMPMTVSGKVARRVLEDWMEAADARLRPLSR